MLNRNSDVDEIMDLHIIYKKHPLCILILTINHCKQVKTVIIYYVM